VWTIVGYRKVRWWKRGGEGRGERKKLFGTMKRGRCRERGEKENVGGDKEGRNQESNNGMVQYHTSTTRFHKYSSIRIPWRQDSFTNQVRGNL